MRPRFVPAATAPPQATGTRVLSSPLRCTGSRAPQRPPYPHRVPGAAWACHRATPRTRPGRCYLLEPAVVGIEEWLALLKESKVMSDDLTRREAILTFVWSRMRVPDALTNRFTVETLTQTDCYEAVCRIADFMSVTPIEDLEEIGKLLTKTY